MSIPPIEPFVPDPDPAPLSPKVDLNPPMVGFATPFIPADGQNRDLILDSIRTWLRTVLWGWAKRWQAFWVKFIADVTDWLNRTIDSMWDYIDNHTLKSWRIGTVVTGAPGTDADATITGTLTDPILNFVIPRGLSGFSWRQTLTPISDTVASVVTIPSVPANWPLQVNDYVLSTSSAEGRYGQITEVLSANSARVTYRNKLQGEPGVDGTDGTNGQDGVAVPGEANIVTTSLVPGGVWTGTIDPAVMSGFSTIEMSGPGVVRVYANTAYLTADSGRPANEPIDISGDHGLYLQYTGVPGSLFKTLTPGVQVTELATAPIAVSIQNTDIVSRVITVDINYMAFRL